MLFKRPFTITFRITNKQLLSFFIIADVMLLRFYPQSWFTFLFVGVSLGCALAKLIFER